MPPQIDKMMSEVSGDGHHAFCLSNVTVTFLTPTLYWHFKARAVFELIALSGLYSLKGI